MVLIDAKVFLVSPKVNVHSFESQTSQFVESGLSMRAWQGIEVTQSRHREELANRLQTNGRRLWDCPPEWEIYMVKPTSNLARSLAEHFSFPRHQPITAWDPGYIRGRRKTASVFSATFTDSQAFLPCSCQRLKCTLLCTLVYLMASVKKGNSIQQGKDTDVYVSSL